MPFPQMPPEGSVHTIRLYEGGPAALARYEGGCWTIYSPQVPIPAARISGYSYEYLGMSNREPPAS